MKIKIAELEEEYADPENSCECGQCKQSREMLAFIRLAKAVRMSRQKPTAKGWQEELSIALAAFDFTEAP